MEESLSTCRFAMRCSRVQQVVHVNRQRDLRLVVARLRSEQQQYEVELKQLRRQGGVLCVVCACACMLCVCVCVRARARSMLCFVSCRL